MSVRRVLPVTVVLLLAMSRSHGVQAAEEVVSVDVNLSGTGYDDGNAVVSEATYNFNIEDCREFTAANYDITITWNLDDAGLEGAIYSVKVRNPLDESCDEYDTADLEEDDCVTFVEGAGFEGDDSISVTLLWSEITRLFDPGVCEDDGGAGFVYLVFASTGDELPVSDEVWFDLHNGEPGEPIINHDELASGESTINISWDEGSTDADNMAVEYTVFYSTEPFDASWHHNELEAGEAGALNSVTTDALFISITDGITVGNTYYLTVTATNEVGNHSKSGEVVMVTTEPVSDFYEWYRASGGSATGCSATGLGSGAMWMMALALVPLVRRRRRAA